MLGIPYALALFEGIAALIIAVLMNPNATQFTVTL
jgi:hypothetical protein